MKFIKSFIIIFLLSSSLSVFTQEVRENLFKIRITPLHLSEESDLDGFLENIYTSANEMNYDVVTARGEAADLEVQILNLHYDSEPDDSFAFIIHKSNNLLQELSPILSTRFNLPYLIDFYDEWESPNSDQYLIQLIDITANYLQGNCEIVTEIFERLEIDEFNDYTIAYLAFILGNCSIIEEKFEDAIEYFEGAIVYNLNPERFVPIAPATNLAWVHVQINDIESAINVMDTVVNVEIDSYPYAQSLALQKRAQIHALIFDYTSAIEDMDSAIGLAESNYHLARAYKQRGDIIMLIYEWNRALEDYNIAIELDPEYAEAYYRRGILLYTMVERENAIADFETYLALAPDGQFVESATEYIESIQTELGALGG